MDPFPSVDFRDLNTFDRLTIPVPISVLMSLRSMTIVSSDHGFAVPGRLVTNSLSSLVSRSVLGGPDPSRVGGVYCNLCDVIGSAVLSLVPSGLHADDGLAPWCSVATTVSSSVVFSSSFPPSLPSPSVATPGASGSSVKSGKNCRFTALHRQLAPLALDHIGLFFKG